VRSTLIVVVVAVLCACGNKESDKPAPSKESPSADPPKGAALDIAGFCKRTMKGANPDQCYGKDAQAESIKASMCTEFLGGAHSAGKITIDAAKLSACEQAVVAALPTLDNQRGLNHLAEQFEACRGVVTGKLEAGAECLGTMECAPGLLCRSMTCAPPAAEGQKCTPAIEMTMAVVDSTCAAGLWCDVDGYVCRPRAAEGSECILSDSCAEGLRCRGKKCVPAAPSKAGEECDDTAECPSGHFCALEGLCEALRADGESCLSNSQCLHQCVTTGDSISGTCGPC